MDINEKFNAVDKFMSEIYEKGKSNVVCPVCQTPLEILKGSSCYTVKCQTPNCLIEVFRGI